MNLGLGYSEILVIMVIALIVIGPRRLPEMLRTAGKFMGQLRRASDDIRREILFSDEINEVRKTIRDTVDPFSPPPVPPRLKTKKKAPDGEAAKKDGPEAANQPTKANDD